MTTRNEGFTYREEIGPVDDDETLLGYLTRRYSHSTETEWLERIEAGRVLLDDRVAAADDSLRPGQILLWRRPPWTEPDTPQDFAVLFRDEHVLAVAKPAGLPAMPSAHYLRNTLLARVRDHYPEAVPLHRLGRWTSGITIFARSALARSTLAEDWRESRVTKLYRALASGAPAQEDFAVETPIGPVPYPLLGTVHGASAGGKPSRSRVQVVELRGDGFLANVWIDTGRPHQIRIHLAAAGYPLVGDPLYGPGGLPRLGSQALPGDPGYGLHAMAVRFRHPESGQEVEVRCAPPPALRTIANRRPA